MICICAFAASFCDSFLGLQYAGSVAQSGSIKVATWIVTDGSLFFCKGICAILDVFEGTEISRVDILRILEGNNVASAKFGVADQISPHLRLDVESFDGIVGEDIACVLESYNVCIIGKDLEGYRVHHLSFIVLDKMKLDKLT